MSFDNGTATYATTACTYVGTGPIATGGGEQRRNADLPRCAGNKIPSHA